MSNNVKITWYRSPIDKAKLKELTAQSDLKAFIQMLSHLIIMIALGVLVYISFQRFSLWFSIPVYYIYATLFPFIGFAGPGHELSHRTVFKTKFWNEFFIIIISFLTWSNYFFFRTSHVRHHQFTTHRILDMEVVQPLKIKRFTWPMLFLFNIRNLIFTIKLMTRHSFGIIKGEWEERLYPESNVKGKRQMFMWARIILLGHLFLAVIFILTGQWILLLLVTFAPFMAQWLNFFTGFTQHAGLPGDVDDFRIICRTVKVNPILGFFYWQMQYHVEHHMYAGVPFYNLKKLRKAIETDLPPAHKGIIAAWKEIFPILKKQKEDPNYCHYPEVPAPVE
ncbi:MAG: fatty acid desaturase [Clostridia bacterium]